MRARGFALFLILLSLGFRAHGEVIPRAQKTLSLDQAIDLGVRNATLVLKQQTNREITGADLLAAYGRFLPNLGVSAGFGYSTGKQFVGANAGVADATFRQGSWQVSSAINIFDGFGDQSNLRAASNRDSASALTLERARQQIAIDVTQSFLQVYLDNTIVDIDTQNLRVSQERLKLIRAKRNVGSANDADLYRQESETAQDESALIDARERAHVDLLRLLQKIRIDARENYVIVEPSLNEQIARLPSEKDLIEEALRDRKDYEAQKHVTEAASQDVTTAQKSYWPTLDLAATFGGVGRNYSSLSIPEQPTITVPANQEPLLNQLGTQTVFTVGLNLNWAIFDRFVTTDLTRRAVAEETNSKIDLDDLSKQVIVDVRTGYSDYQTAAAQSQTTSVAETAAQKAFDVISGRYRVGASSYLDLTAAQAQLVQARQQHATALVNLRLRSQALLFYTGRDPRGRL